MEIKLKLDFRIEPLQVKIKHGDRSLLLGSCFSNEIGFGFKENGFDILSNPFGTVFHPEPIARMLIETLSGKCTERIFQRHDLFFSWDAAGTVFAFSESELRSELEIRRKQLIDYLKNSKYLFVTFGSAFGYQENESGSIVANCHRMPGNIFSKQLTGLNLMVNLWSNALDKIHELNPRLQIVFTVSPVRHVKDGLIENNRSKSRLFELIGELQCKPNVHYFPSYEIVVDELRDYRFYKSDGIHPDEQAIQYVWERLKEVVFSPETQSICNEFLHFRKLENHRTLYENSQEALLFEESSSQKIKDFMARHPEVLWNEKP